MTKKLSLEEAIEIIRPLVKYSTTVEGQKHIDLSVATADKRFISQEALVALKAAVVSGEKTQEEINTLLGI